MDTSRIKIDTVQLQRKGLCAYTGDTLDVGEKCWFVENYGLFRQDLTEEGICEHIEEENAEGMACELEAALTELTRRNINLDTPAFRRYRDLHPRQDS